MLHRTLTLAAALALLPVTGAAAQEPQPAPPAEEAPAREGDRAPSKAAPPEKDGRKAPGTAPAKPKPRNDRPPPTRAEKKDEKAPAASTADAENPCVPVKPCSID